MRKKEQVPTRYESRVLQELELANRWGMAVTTLQKWRQNSVGPNFLKLSSGVRYPIEAIEEFERENLRKSTSEKA
jgi:hypothetical protein